MSLKTLTSIAKVFRHPLTASKDASMDTNKTIGVADKVLKCRRIPMTTAEAVAYQQRDRVEVHKLAFHKDPGLSNNTIVSDADGKVYRVLETKDAHKLGRYFTAVVRHEPQIEVPAS